MSFSERMERRYPRLAVPSDFRGIDRLLESWRRATGESREAVQRASGVSAATIERYEKGKRSPQTDELAALLRHYGLDLYALADALAKAQGEQPREEPIPPMAVGVLEGEFPGASPAKVGEMLAARRRLLYYYERARATEDAVKRLREELAAPPAVRA